MSLLDDVSIVVTPNGYKAGELYSVVPVPTEGAEEVTYPNFTNSDISQWTMSSGRASKSWDAAEFMRLDFSIGNGAALYAVFGQTLNARYKVTMRVRGTKADGVTAQGSTFGSIGDSSEQGEVISNPNLTAEWQDYEFYVVSTNTVFRFYLFSAAIGDLVDFDSISVKEYTSADMDVTRATAATRVDENGLVNYAEIIGGEEVPSIIGILNAGGGTITQISGNSYSSTSDGTSGSGIRPKFDFNTTAGKRYKLTITPTGTISGTINFDFYDGSSYLFQNYDFTTTKEIYFIDNGSVFGAFDGAKTYDVSSFTVSVKEVTRDNVPRIDYTGGGCPHILAEPERTNNLTASQDLTDSFWNSSTRLETVVASTVLSPDGTTFGFKAIPTTSNSTKYLDYDFGFLSMPSSSEVTYSIFVKPFGYTNFQLATSSGMLSRYQNFELTGDGVVGAGDVNGATIDKIGDWYRCSITDTTTSLTTPRVLSIPTPTSGLGRNPTFTGNGTDGVLLWGAQLEEGSYGTSYIPNLSTVAGSTITRNQDIFTRDGIGSLINSTEGVLFAEIAALSDDGTYRYMGLTDGTDDNRVIILYYTSSTRIRVLISSGGTKYFDEYYGVTSILDFHKVAVKFKENDFALWIDGVERATDTSGSTPIGLNTLALDQAGGDNFYGKVKQLQVYKTALTDEQLLQLTGESGTDFYESYAEMASALTYTIQ